MYDCYFLREDGECKCLTIGFCKNPETCKFRKTKDEYIRGRDNAIKACRKKHLCDGCRYVFGARCKLSSEMKSENGMAVLE